MMPGPAPQLDRLRAFLGPSRILLVGGGGMLGRAFREFLAHLALPFDAPPRAELDLVRPATIAPAVAGNRKLVINCAAWTNVDGAETDEPGALALNATAVAELARCCKAANATLVHFSTDYVFSGISTSPYRTDQPRDPLNAYGRTKAAGEEALERSGVDHLTLRTSWLYAPWGSNFVRTIARAASQKPLLRVVNDQRGRPTSSEHLARSTLAMLNAGARGIHHATDSGDCTWFDFATRIVELRKASAKVEPCTTAEFPRPAVRPAYSVLDISRTESLIGPLTSWTDALESVVSRLET